VREQRPHRATVGLVLSRVAYHALPSVVYINKPMEDQEHQNADNAPRMKIATTTIDRCLTNA
jgi:hypothetical protein